MQNSLNNFQVNKFKITFSNLPTITNINDLNHFTTNYVKSITNPEYSVDVVYSEYQNFITANPISKINDEFSPLTLEYKLSENFENYTYFHTYIKNIRAGDSGKESLKQYVINNIDVITLDNQNREKKILRFSDVLPSSISSIVLEFGSADEVTFNMTFLYRNLEIVDFVN